MDSFDDRFSSRSHSGSRSDGDDSQIQKTVSKFKAEYRRTHAGALKEIRRGRKQSCWSWWIWPTNHRPGTSGMSLAYALSDEAAVAFMRDDYLRSCWLEMMNAVAEQVEGGVTMNTLCGIDVPRVPATCELMNRVVGAEDAEVAEVCTRVQRAISEQSSRKTRRKNDGGGANGEFRQNGIGESTQRAKAEKSSTSGSTEEEWPAPVATQPQQLGGKAKVQNPEDLPSMPSADFPQLTQEEQQAKKVLVLGQHANEIVEGLYLGSEKCVALAMSSELSELEITAIVNCSKDVSSPPIKVKHVRVPVSDGSNGNLLPYLGGMADFINKQLSIGGKVLVHCPCGSSPSAVIVIAFLMKHRGMSRDRGYALAKSRRPEVAPNFGFWAQLGQFEAQVAGAAGSGEDAPGEAQRGRCCRSRYRPQVR